MLRVIYQDTANTKYTFHLWSDEFNTYKTIPNLERNWTGDRYKLLCEVK